ncbi:hypothetical protein Tco_0271873 [Tanacetum coccineum]
MTKSSNPKLARSGKKKLSPSSDRPKDIIQSHPSPPTLVVGEMHKEAQQAAGGSTSLGATSEEGAYPQLNSDSTAKADPGLSIPNDSMPA